MLKKSLVYLRGFGRESVLGPLFKLLEAGFELFVPLVVASMIDGGILARDTAHVWKMGGILVLLGFAGLAFSITAQYFAARAAVGFSARLREALYDRVTRLSPAQLDALGAPRLTQRLTGDVDTVQSGLNLALRLMLRSPFVVFGAMIMAFTVDARSAWVFAVAIPVIVAENIEFEIAGTYTALRMLLTTAGTALGTYVSGIVAENSAALGLFAAAAVFLTAAAAGWAAYAPCALFLFLKDVPKRRAHSYNNHCRSDKINHFSASLSQVYTRH